MTDIQTASSKALEIIMLQRAKQQAYMLLHEQATDRRGEYLEKAIREREILDALIDMATGTKLLNYSDCDMYNIRLVERVPE